MGAQKLESGIRALVGVHFKRVAHARTIVCKAGPDLERVAERGDHTAFSTCSVQSSCSQGYYVSAV